MSLRIELVNNITAFKTLKRDWNTLYEHSHHGTLFISWDWMYTWWEVYGNDPCRKLYILCAYEDDQLLGIAPFQIEKKFPLSLIVGRQLQFIGTGEADNDNILSEFGDFLIVPEKRKEVYELFATYLLSHNDWDFADFNYLVKDAFILSFFKGCMGQGTDKHTSFQGQILVSGVRYTIPRVDSFDDYHQTLSKRWAKMFTKKYRKLERDGDIKILQTESIKTVEADLALLADMHRSRWTQRTDQLIFDSEQFYEFHSKILNRLVPQGKAYIRTLTLNNKPLAAYYAFTDKSHVHYYQSGFYAEKANLYSPLFLLICKEIGLANEQGKLFDFMFSEPKSYKETQYAAKTEALYRLILAHKSYRLIVFNGLRKLKCHYEKMYNFIDSLQKKKKS